MARCSQCGTALSNDLLDGHCPQCLVHFTFEKGEPHAGNSAAHFEGTFGDYELLEEIARGGMGVVYRARQRSLNRLVALKMLLAGEFASPDFVRRFQKEAEAAAGLQHPNIVAIHEIGRHRDQHFFSMDLIEGRNLADLVREQPLPARHAAAYLRTIAEAVAFAHDKGTLHRDLKPSNILIDCFDQPRITDFGLAKQFLGPPDLTKTAQAIGSPAYMAPEQITAEASKFGPAVDIYSLGALLYHLITGRPPFQGETLHQIIRQLQENEPLAPRLLNPDVPPDLEIICLKCLEKEPARRYATAQELAKELDRFLQGEPVQAHPISRMEQAWRWCRRKPMVASLTATVGALLIVLMAGSWLAAWRIERARRAESHQRERATQANVELAQANTRLQQSVTTLELQRAEEFFRAGDPSMGLAQLAGILRRDPTNHIAAERILSALLHSNWVLPMGNVLRHPSFVSSVAFSPSGQYVVSGCSDGFARVWNAGTRRQIGSGLQHPRGLRSVCFSPDETRIATACEDGTVRIWNWHTSDVTVIRVSPGYWVFSVAFSPDGEWVVSASGDKTARVWSARTGELRLVLRGHTDAVRRAVFSPDGRLIATASEDGSARLWNANTGEPFGRVVRHPFGGHVLNGIAFSPDGTRLATSSRDRMAVVWNVDTGTLALPPLRHPDGLNAVQFDATGRVIVTTGFDNTIRLWDAQSGQVVSQAFRHLEQVNQAAFSPDGRLLATAGDDQIVRIWEIQPGQTLPEPMRHDSTVNWVEFSRDGKWLATASYDHTGRIWDADPGLPVTGPLQHAGNVQRIAFSPDARFVVTASGDSSAWVWDIKTGRRAKGPFVHASGLWAASFSPDGRRLVTASADGTARIWDIDSQAPITPPLRHDEQVFMARFSPDGTRVATASRDHTARVWDVVSGAAVTTSLPHIDEVLDVQFSPDGLRVATASRDNTGRIWDARSGQPIGSVLRHLRTVNAIAFSHDGLRLVTASADHTARIWDATTGEPLTPALEHDDTVLQACFSPDDQRVVTASMDRSARIWDVKTGLPLSEPLWHREPVCAAQFSPDGERLATGAFSPVYPGHIWRVPVASSPVPDWLPALAEAVAGLPAGPQGATRLMSEADFDQLRERLLRLSGEDVYSRVARWFLADRATRTVSPFQSEKAAEYVQRRIEENTRAGLEEAVRLEPTNSLALVHLAKAILGGDSAPANEADAAHLARLALRFDPNQAEAREMLASIGDPKHQNTNTK